MLPDLGLSGGPSDGPQVQEDLHHRLHQLRFLASETDDPLAERLVRDLIVELEDRLMAEALNAPASPALAKGAA